MMTIAIIGGGLAGTACAYVLAQAGLTPVIFDASDRLAAGASGNPFGIFNPRLSAEINPESLFYAQAFDLAGRTFEAMARTHNIGLSRHGSLHLATDSGLRKRYEKAVDSGLYEAAGGRYLRAADGADRAGIALSHDALWLPGSGAVKPAEICRAYARGADLRLNVADVLPRRTAQGWEVDGQTFEAVILACGTGVLWFPETAWLPVYPVRGQLVRVAPTDRSAPLRCTVCYGGYLAPGMEGLHVAGSTFQRHRTDTDIDPTDNDLILQRLVEALPEQDMAFETADAQAGIRAAAHDHFPIAGAVPDRAAWESGKEEVIPGLYVSTGHGSHGLVSTLAAAHVVAAQILARTAGQTAGQDLGRVGPLDEGAARALDPARFLRRARRRGEAIFGSGIAA
ncbi:MAG TPA: FAD-dependent 5-carboxymethylaminomethyl-2-thiouridine(34) oxidoreductase MnmC [Alphaproteobacteria bacterium]|nr:FAD-dependent 5-carboxymethylaminomethyl-2-thiouridine(34) oxidoreductase MnmC [Alphaproteobacteria bacterium]